VRKNILIVDDESIIVSSTLQFLSGKGYNVVATNSPEAVISLINSEKFDVIITDLKMQPISGIDIIKHLISLGFTGKTILISAYYKDHERELNTLRVDAFLEKPFMLEELKKKIEELTG
jgi:DNA-binding NtrC family response regulator